MGVRWGTGVVTCSTFLILLPFLLLQSSSPCPFCLELGSTLALPTLSSGTTEVPAVQPGAIAPCLRLSTAQPALPTIGFPTATRRFERAGCHIPALCFPSQHQGCFEACEAPQVLASSSRVSEVQRFCTKTCCAGALPHQPLWGHMEQGRGLGMGHDTGVRQPDVLGLQ